MSPATSERLTIWWPDPRHRVDTVELPGTIITQDLKWPEHRLPHQEGSGRECTSCGDWRSSTVQRQWWCTSTPPSLSLHSPPPSPSAALLSLPRTWTDCGVSLAPLRRWPVRLLRTPRLSSKDYGGALQPQTQTVWDTPWKQEASVRQDRKTTRTVSCLINKAWHALPPSSSSVFLHRFWRSLLSEHLTTAGSRGSARPPVVEGQLKRFFRSHSHFNEWNNSCSCFARPSFLAQQSKALMLPEPTVQFLLQLDEVD